MNRIEREMVRDKKIEEMISKIEEMHKIIKELQEKLLKGKK